MGSTRWTMSDIVTTTRRGVPQLRTERLRSTLAAVGLALAGRAVRLGRQRTYLWLPRMVPERQVQPGGGSGVWISPASYARRQFARPSALASPLIRIGCP